MNKVRGTPCCRRVPRQLSRCEYRDPPVCLGRCSLTLLSLRIEAEAKNAAAIAARHSTQSATQYRSPRLIAAIPLSTASALITTVFRSEKKRFTTTLAVIESSRISPRNFSRDHDIFIKYFEYFYVTNGACSAN